MQEHDAKKPPSRKLRKIAIALTASIAGISIAGATAAVIAYNAMFERFERPDYDTYPGLYDYNKIADVLPREEFKLKSGDEDLQAYFYPSQCSYGLVVLAHGFHAGADDYLPLIEAVVNEGYSVLTYDVTGTYSSSGDSVVGMCQSLIDLNRVLNYVSQNDRYSALPLYLVGHSWGGYAVSSVLELHPEVKACVCIAPMCSAPDIMVQKAEEYVGGLAYTAKPVYDVYQNYLFGDFTKYNGIRGINSTNVPILIAQGLNDDVIKHNVQSITARKNEITNPNVTYYYREGLQGTHTGIWHSLESCNYQLEIDERLKDVESKMGRQLTAEEKVEFYKCVDHRLYSEVNSELVKLMIETFNKNK